MDRTTCIAANTQCFWCGDNSPIHENGMFKWIVNDRVLGYWGGICEGCANRIDPSVDDSEFSQVIYRQGANGIAHPTLMVNGKRTIQL